MSLLINNQFSSLVSKPWNPNGTPTVLVSGCGISWSGQKDKTWVNLLALSGIKVCDVGGPAVSNLWILNHAIDYIVSNKVNYAVIQLTSLGKLDVEVDQTRYQELVESDSVRNFTVDGIWPSSSSVEHPAKLLWKQWLHSPTLELNDIEVKLKMLKFYCDHQQIPLLVLAGYDEFSSRREHFRELIHNVDSPIYKEYQQSVFFNPHATGSPVPVLPYQLKILEMVNSTLQLGVESTVDKLRLALKSGLC